VVIVSELYLLPVDPIEAGKAHAWLVARCDR
jgi:hypothetical protein